MSKAIPAKKLDAMTPAELAAEMRADIARFQHDPAGYIFYAFPWGKKGTPLEKMRPRKWLLDLCARIRAGLLANAARPDLAWPAVRQAIASGNGIGKSAGAMQLLLWAMSTFEECRGVVTANTDAQLRTKTWPELVKWHSMCINRDWFEVTATAIFARGHGSPQERMKAQRNWRIDAVPWSVNNLEAFQGLHNLGKRIFLFMDEASGIDDPVWETAERSLTDEGTEILWIALGNPTRSNGRFRECWTKFREMWEVANVDARTVEGTNRTEHERWLRTYKEHSQFFQSAVVGQFVEADANQLFSLEWIAEARMRGYQVAQDGSHSKTRLSADIANGGANDTVYTVFRHYSTFRHALRQVKASYRHAVAVPQAAEAIKTMWTAWACNPSKDDIVVDSNGVGAGTAGNLIKYDQLPVVQHYGGEASSNPKRFRNRRVQCYIAARNDLRDGCVAIAPDFVETEDDWREFEAQMCSIKIKVGTERVEDLPTKEEMARDGVDSPDRADSWAMQYATIVPTILGAQTGPPMPARVIEAEFKPAW